MNLVGLELNDSALAAVGDRGLLFSEPGYAIERDGIAVFGDAARKFLRLSPRRIASRYWEALAEQALPQPLGGCRTEADLVHAHLQRLWEQVGDEADGAVLAVPGHWTVAQLGLLLGIAQEQAINVRGLVDLAVAATRQEYVGGLLLHLDISLHHATVSRMGQQGKVTVEDRYVIAGAGVERLERVCVELIARQFVDASRFDPLLEAETEQYLYDHLPRWLAGLNDRNRLSLTVPHRGNEFSATLDRAALLDALGRACEPVVQQIRPLLTAGQPVAIQCPSQWALFPGALEAFAQLPGVEVFVLEPCAAAWGALQRFTHLAGNGRDYRLATSLPWDRAAIELRMDAAATDLAAAAAPTHVLFGATAYRLGRAPLRIGAEVPDGEYGIVVTGHSAAVSRQHCSIHVDGTRVVLTDQSRYGTRLNGHPVNGSAFLQAGDVIGIGQPEAELRLIAEIGDR